MALGTGALMPTNGQAPFHILLIRATFYILLYSIRSWAFGPGSKGNGELPHPQDNVLCIVTVAVWSLILPIIIFR